ncbi:hypothetical protein [Streptosporangium sp. NPDC002607]
MRLTAEVEPIRTGPQPEDPPVEPASTPARQQASPSENWVNFSTYLPAPVRRELRARCALLDIEQRQAVTDAVLAWLAEHPAEQG